MPRTKRSLILPALVALIMLSMVPASAWGQTGVAGVYDNTNEGLRVVLPPGWTGEETGSQTPLLEIFGSTDGELVSGDVWLFSLSELQTAKQWLDTEIGFYSPDATLESGPLSAEGADTAHKTIIASSSGDLAFVEVWAVAVRGSRLFLLRTLTTTKSWPTVRDAAEAFIGSVRLDEPAPFGARRSDSLFQYWGEIATLDPVEFRGSPGGIPGAIFSGLVKFDTDIQVVPDIAERWDVSADGTVFTFHLRADARFHDGTTVTAEDFKYSWERALSPDTESPTASTYLGDIVGAAAMLDGTASSVAGIEVLDPRTLRVTIDAPKPYFIFKLVYPTAYVVDRNNVESGGGDWYDEPNGTGAFKLKEWQKDELLVLERNDDWYGGTPALAHSVYRIFAGVPMIMYESGEIDLTGLGVSNIDRARDPANPLSAHYLEGTQFCTSYIGFNVTTPPFDDPAVRQALALALDLDKQIAVTRRGLDVRAAGIVPPGIPAHNSDLEPSPFDPERAKTLIAGSAYGSDGMPAIESYVSNGAVHWAWREYLGLDVEAVDLFTFEDFLARQDNHELPVFSSGWCADYPDPQNFLEVLFHSESGENKFQYENPNVDDLLERAAIEQDSDVRAALYQEAERIILDDWVVVPLWHGTQQMLVQPYVEGFVLAPIGVPQLHNIRIAR